MGAIFKLFRWLIFWLLFLLALWIYSNRAPETPETSELEAPPPRDFAALEGPADLVFIDKSQRQMILMQNGMMIKSYPISLGFSPEGQKTQQGDGKTPTGDYTIDWRNEQSQFYRSLHISYPTPAQTAFAAAEARDPGGMIMIHGQPNASEYVGIKRIPADWTNGCIAVSNAEMDEIWARVPNGTPITIIE